MSALRPPLFLAPPDHPTARSRRAFSLPAVALATLLFGLATALAVPLTQKLLIASRSAAVAEDLRAFSPAFVRYLQEKGDWPPQPLQPGQIPPGMEPYLNASRWTKITPIGGHYHWQNQQHHQGRRVRAAIAITSQGGAPVSTERLQLEAVDRRLDDGALDTGTFRLGFRDEPIAILEP